MISTKEVKIEKPIDFTSEYVEQKLKNMGFDVLRWAVTDYDEKSYTLSLAVVED